MVTDTKSNNIRIKMNTTPFISGNMRLVQTRFIDGASQGRGMNGSKGVGWGWMFSTDITVFLVD